MATELTRITFAVTQEMKPLLLNAKKEWFYDCSQSDMIRKLVPAGLNALDKRTPKSEAQ